MIPLLRGIASLALLLPLAQMGATKGGGPDDREVIKPPGPIKRDYAISPEQAKELVGQVMEKAGLTVDPEAEAPEWELASGWVRFSREDFGQNVAIPPPRLSPVYPYMQPQWMSTGEYRLLVRFEQIEHVARVFFLAELRIFVFNSFTFEKDQLVRDSDGTIEKVLLESLSEKVAALATESD